MPPPLEQILHDRFQSDVSPLALGPDADTALARIAGRGSCRTFTSKPVPGAMLEALCAVALSAPSKSDLQQRDIVIVEEEGLRTELLGLLSAQAWTGHVPHLLVFCGNHARQRTLHDLSGHPFANDHLDGFFNAAVDAGIALSAFVLAAEAAGLGCCPISTVRNFPDEVDRLLNLPDFVFPVAGLAVGYPASDPPVSRRLPLSCTVHRNRYPDADVAETLTAYDALRHRHQPYPVQRRSDTLGEAAHYGWIEDKTRQYSLPERADFGAYVRRKGFSLD